MTKSEKSRVLRLERYCRYNRSRKGKARYAKYEAEHPERALPRWEPARNTRHTIEPEPDIGPSYEWYRELYEN